MHGRHPRGGRRGAQSPRRNPTTTRAGRRPDRGCAGLAAVDCASGAMAVVLVRAPCAQDMARARCVTDALRARLADRLQRVILFGSRARGEATEESDLDLVILVDRRDPSVKRAVDDAAWTVYPTSVDVQVFTPERWRWSVAAGAPLLRHALEEGINLWPPPATD